MMFDPNLKNFEEELAEFLETNRRPAPVYTGRVCRYCGGPTVAACVKPWWERTGRAAQGAPRRRFSHLRGIPLIAPRKRAVRVSALGKVPRHRRSSRVVVSYTPKGVGWRTAKGWVR